MQPATKQSRTIVLVLKEVLVPKNGLKRHTGNQEETELIWHCKLNAGRGLSFEVRFGANNVI